jgi:CubicO group peptidase (beta-lactamase class C family)
MASYSMAKTIVAMLIGIALSEDSIESIDDHAAKYVPELKDTPYGETRIRHLRTMSSESGLSKRTAVVTIVATLARLSILGESEGAPPP